MRGRSDGDEGLLSAQKAWREAREARQEMEASGDVHENLDFAPCHITTVMDHASHMADIHMGDP